MTAPHLFVLARSSVLRLPPHLRASAYQHTLTRAFHASQPRKSTLIDLAIGPPTFILNSLHGLGLPWYAALPVAAVLVRGVIIHYGIMLPAQKATRVRTNLLPLASVHTLYEAYAPHHLRRRDLWPQPWQKRLDFVVTRWWVRRQRLNKLSKEFGVPTNFRGAVLNFATLIAFTEAVRMKCGAHLGLLSAVLSPLQWMVRALGFMGPDHLPPTPTVEPTPATSRQSILAESPEQAVTTNEYVNIVDGLSSVQQVPLAHVEPSAWFDPSMQTEGFGWCLDLTAPDPTFLLPIVLWLSISANIIFRQTVGDRDNAARKVTRTSQDAEPPKSRVRASDLGIDDPEAAKVLATPAYGTTMVDKRFLGIMPPITNIQRIGLCVAVLLFGAMLKMPVAVLLYFIPSLGLGWVQRRWLNAKLPIPSPIQPCTRPLRLKVKKEWRD